MAISLLAAIIAITNHLDNYLLQQQYRNANYKGREELSVLNSQLQENIVGMNVVQLFRREKFNAELFRTTNKRYTKQMDETILYDSAVSATLEWISLIAIAGVLWMGGWLLLEKNLTFGILSAFILYAQQLFDPLRRFCRKIYCHSSWVYCH